MHKQWDEPTAILSGDLLQIEVYEKLTAIGNWDIMHLFNTMARELCEGQMNDMLFESKPVVSNEDYLEMIRQKTAVLLGFCLQGGALLGGASKHDAKKLYQLGLSIGLSFQLMDDYLDTFGQTAKVGKRIGGDILEQKKTYLWNEMWSSLTVKAQNDILSVYQQEDEESIIDTVRKYMEQSGAKSATLSLALKHTQESFDTLDQLNTQGSKEYLKAIVSMLATREQ